MKGNDKSHIAPGLPLNGRGAVNLYSTCDQVSISVHGRCEPPCVDVRKPTMSGGLTQCRTRKRLGEGRGIVWPHIPTLTPQRNADEASGYWYVEAHAAHHVESSALPFEEVRGESREGKVWVVTVVGTL